MRLTERQLRKFIRNIILAEGMKMPEQFGDDLRIEVINAGYDMSTGKYSPQRLMRLIFTKKAKLPMVTLVSLRLVMFL